MKKFAQMALFAAVALVVTGCNGWGCGCCPKPSCCPKERCCAPRPACCDYNGNGGGEYTDGGYGYEGGYDGNGNNGMMMNQNHPVAPPVGK